MQVLMDAGNITPTETSCQQGLIHATSLIHRSCRINTPAHALRQRLAALVVFSGLSCLAALGFDRGTDYKASCKSATISFCKILSWSVASMAFLI